jgi:hypothetical protein
VAAVGDAGALAGAELAGAGEATAADETAGAGDAGADDGAADDGAADDGAGGGAEGRNELPTEAALCTGTSNPVIEPPFLKANPTTTVSPCVSGTVRLRSKILTRAVPGAPAVAAGIVVLPAACSSSALAAADADDDALAGTGATVTLTSGSAALAMLMALNWRYASPPLADVTPLGNAMIAPRISRLLPIWVLAAWRLATAWRVGEPKPVAHPASPASSGAQAPTRSAVRSGGLPPTKRLLTNCPLRLTVWGLA